MKKRLRLLVCFLFFLPALAATLLSVWVFIYPFFLVPQQIDFPCSILFFLFTLWCSGVLLCTGRCWGGVITLLLPVLNVLSSLNRYSGHQHLSPLPLLWILTAYCLVCAGLCHRMKRGKER